MNLIVKIGLGVAIAIIFPLMVGLGTEAFYPAPKDPYQKCQELLPAAEEKMNPEQDPSYKKCTDEAQKAMDVYNRNVFIPITIIGFAAIAVGALYTAEAWGPVSPGLVFGGLFTILYGAGRSFTAVDKRWLFLELVVVLVGLIIVTQRYLKRDNKV